MSGPRDRDGRNVIHEGDTVSVLAPAVMADHDGVGEVTQVGTYTIAVTDSQGREWRGYACDVSVDWSDYPPES